MSLTYLIGIWFLFCTFLHFLHLKEFWCNSFTFAAGRRANNERTGDDGVPYWANPGSASPDCIVNSRAGILDVCFTCVMTHTFHFVFSTVMDDFSRGMMILLLWDITKNGWEPLSQRFSLLVTHCSRISQILDVNFFWALRRRLLV